MPLCSLYGIGNGFACLYMAGGSPQWTSDLWRPDAERDCGRLGWGAGARCFMKAGGRPYPCSHWQTCDGFSASHLTWGTVHTVWAVPCSEPPVVRFISVHCRLLHCQWSVILREREVCRWNPHHPRGGALHAGPDPPLPSSQPSANGEQSFQKANTVYCSLGAFAASLVRLPEFSHWFFTHVQRAAGFFLPSLPCVCSKCTVLDGEFQNAKKTQQV